MLFQALSLTVIGMFFALAAFDNSSSNQDPLSSLEEINLGCSCKKKRKNSFKESLIACACHDEEPLEEET